MARINKRTGFSANRGALNPKITQGVDKPRNPKRLDIHLDFERGIISRYNGSSWDNLQMIYLSDTEPNNKGWLWYDSVNFALKYYADDLWN